ncbi:MAG: hypothetical protein QXP60_09695 [Nitrososphaerota archaeon]
MKILPEKLSNTLFLIIGIVFIFLAPYVNVLLYPIFQWPISLLFAIIVFLIGIFIIYKFVLI